MKMDTKKEKLLLTQGQFAGGLIKAKQQYGIYYLEATEKYPIDKISLEITMISNETDGKKIKPRSLRFNNTEQLGIFVSDMVNAYAYFLRRRGKITPENFDIVIGNIINNIRLRLNQKVKKDYK